jgi:ribonuclease R
MKHQKNKNPSRGHSRKTGPRDSAIHEIKLKDKYAEREAAKYDNPIASRELIMQALEKQTGALFFDEILALLKISQDDQKEALSRRLNAMVRDGQLVRNRRGQFGLAKKMDLIKGRVVGHPDGFGFLVPESADGDLFISAREMQQIFHGDVVLARVSGVDRRGRREGSIVEVLEHNTQEVVGHVHIEDEMAFVLPDNNRVNHEILIPLEHLAGAQQDQIVVAKITHQPTKRSKPIGHVIDILGDYMSPGLEIDIALRSHNIRHSWPAALQAEIAGLTEQVKDEDKAGRLDLTSLNLVTIDGEDSRDFDDAVYCETHPQGGWTLWVAIADVSHYVKPDTQLDQEAFARSTSVYFPDFVVPMLPEILSNGLCSLNPQTDRLCLVAQLYIDPDGQILSYDFHEGVMHSKARLTYNKVAKILVDKDPALRQTYAPLIDDLENLYSLYHALLKARHARGTIEFDSPETRIIFDEHRKIEKIIEVHRNDAHKVIEEAMLAANVAAARFLGEQKMPLLYRVHGKPKTEKLETLRKFLGDFGIQLGGGESPVAADFSAVMAQAKGRPEEHLIQTMVLRSMNQAVYSPDNEGHFGLAFDEYAHFTSPIRRYPDLLVHRAIRYVLQNRTKSTVKKLVGRLTGQHKPFDYTHEQMKVMGVHCSTNERRADDATRDVNAWLKCEYVSHRLGHCFAGVISSVTSFGLFIELKGLYVEGLVHISELDNDYFHFDPARMMLKGENTGKRYRLGDAVYVQVVRVDMDERKVDLMLVNHPSVVDVIESEG